MAQTMKEIIGEAYSDVSEDRLRGFLPTIARDAKGEDFINTDADLSSMIRQCLDESTDGGMVGILLPEGGALKPYAVVNRGGILGTESLDNSGSFGFGNRGKKALAKSLQNLIPLAQPVYNDILAKSEQDRQKAKEEELEAKKAKQQQAQLQKEREQKTEYRDKCIEAGDVAYKSLRTGRVFRPEMPDMLKAVMMSQAAAYGALENKSVEEFEAEFKTEDMQTVFSRTAEILDNEIAKRSQMAAEALESKDALWDFITGYQEYLSSKKMSTRDKLVSHGDTAFDELYNMDATDEAQLWKIPELLKQIFLGYLAADESVSEDQITEAQADATLDKAINLVSNITTMNVRLGTLNSNPGACRTEIIRQIDAARKQVN